MRMASDRNYIYVIGGYSPRREPELTEEVWRFNVLTDVWELMYISKENFMQTSASYASCFFGDPYLREFYMFGGSALPFGSQVSNSFSVLKRVTDEMFDWHAIEVTGDVPIEQYGSCLLFHKDRFYMLGGTTGWEYNMEVRSLEPVFGEGSHGCKAIPDRWKWTLLHDGSGVRGRYRHEAVMVDEKIVILGGGSPLWTPALVELLVFDIRRKEFYSQMTLPDVMHGYPIGRLCHGCVGFGDYVYIFGGCSEKGVLQPFMGGAILVPRLFRDLWELDLKEWRWRLLPGQLSQKLCFHGATITQEGCIYVFGGITDKMFQKRTSKLQRCWIRPPSLFHIAARVVVQAYPCLSKRFHDLTLTNIVEYVTSYLQ